ncbi:MAG: alpha/beta hydrolase, partial [Myxococcales bacterium]|nr:alpha/beta hydrolase [Myxococcales bacterium]
MTSPSPERFEFVTPDRVQIRLTRYAGGPKGPVLVAHGVGVWSGMFTLETVRENFTQFLVRNGYDVWLLDWRGSIQLPLTQFTLDQVAENDFPTAVDHILAQTKANSIQAVVHCAGSAAFFMSLAAGRLAGKIRCVSCSQVALHFVVPAATEIKSLVRLPDLLDALGAPYMTPAEDSDHRIFQQAFGAFVDLVHHECTSTICHRITFLYGHLYEHATTNQETHDRLSEQYGKCNITVFRHLAQLAREVVSTRFDYGWHENLKRYGARWPPTYLDPKHLALPITFVSGAKNRTFVPRSTEAT